MVGFLSKSFIQIDSGCGQTLGKAEMAEMAE